MTDTSVDTTEKKIGNVKWFNNKAGYGFITIDENSDSPTDVFVHYSNINVSNSQYKYLVQGEYVEFVLADTPEGKHKFQATNVTGIQGGATLCERRRVSNETAQKQDQDSDERERKPRVRPQSDDAPRRIQTRKLPAAKKEDVDTQGFTTVRKKQVSAKK